MSTCCSLWKLGSARAMLSGSLGWQSVMWETITASMLVEYVARRNFMHTLTQAPSVANSASPRAVTATQDLKRRSWNWLASHDEIGCAYKQETNNTRQGRKAPDRSRVRILAIGRSTSQNGDPKSRRCRLTGKVPLAIRTLSNKSKRRIAMGTSSEACAGEALCSEIAINAVPPYDREFGKTLSLGT